MPEIKKEAWVTVRERFELGEQVAGIAREFGVSYEAIRKRAKAEKWINPRKVAKRAKERLATRDAKIIVREEDRLMQRILDAREDISVAASVAIRKFREDVESGADSGVRDWKGLLNVVEALQKMTGAEEKKKEAHKPKMMEYLQILSGKNPPKLVGTRDAIEVNPA